MARCVDARRPPREQHEAEDRSHSTEGIQAKASFFWSHRSRLRRGEAGVEQRALETGVRYSYVADKRFKVQASVVIPEGDHIFSFQFMPTGKLDIPKGRGVPATVELFIDGKAAGKGNLPVTIPLTSGLPASVSLATDARSPVMRARQ